jgi:uncharacterized cupin superfamily protein
MVRGRIKAHSTRGWQPLQQPQLRFAGTLTHLRHTTTPKETRMPIQPIEIDRGDYEEYFVAPEKRLEGNPKQQVWLRYTDPSGRFFAGTWASEAGKWKIAYTEEEYCELLEGESVITDASGNSQRVSAGDRFVIPRDFTGSWEVVRARKKIFVIYEKGD